jgi:hypothetical protein
MNRSKQNPSKSRSELYADARRAFTLVVNNYAAPRKLTGPGGPIHQHFHFVEADRWAYYLRYIARYAFADENPRRVEAVTHSYATKPKIGVNLSFHTFATLVHESIHFFSHYEFRRSFPVSAYEGATEYLTRNLLNNLSPRRDVNGENDLYASEITPFLALVTDDEHREQLYKAYFLGNRKSIVCLQDDLANQPVTSAQALV